MNIKKILSYIGNKRVSTQQKGIQYFVRTKDDYESRKDAERAMSELSLKSGIPLKHFTIVELWNAEALGEIPKGNPDTLVSKLKQ